jgi:hypothetical protein
MTTQDMLDERYGRRRSRGSTWLVGTFAVAAAAALGALAWTIVGATLDDVGLDNTGYEIVDERTVVVSFQITAPVGRTVACALEAQDVEHGVVGWRIVEIEASDQHARAFRESVPTTALATTGLVNSCWVT